MRSSKILKTSLLLSLSAAALLVGPARAAEGESSENLKNDIRFSRDLARYRFFDLAVEWLAGIEQGGGLDAEARTEVSLAKATISQMASKYALTRSARQGFYDEAVTHYQAAVAGMGDGMTRSMGDAVVEGYAKVLVNKGKFYTDEIARLKADGAGAESIAEARKTSEQAFRLAVKTLIKAYADLTRAAEDLTEAGDEQESQYLLDLSLQSLYRKGESYYYWALLYELQDFNREDYLGKCTESLVDYMWEAGDETVFALYAYYFQGMAEWELGKVEPDKVGEHDEKALTSLTHIFSEYGIDVAQLKNLAEQDRVFVQGLLEKAYRGVSQIYRAAATRLEATETVSDSDDLTALATGYQCVGDKTDKDWLVKAPVFKPTLIAALRGGAVGVVTEMEARLESSRLALTEDGYAALLSKARGLRDAGRAPEALSIAKRVAERNERTLVGLAAQTLLGELLEMTDENAQPASVLRLVADGYIAESRWMDAVDALHGVVRACKTDEDRAEYLFPAWTGIGSSYQALGRHLEAALAFEAGFELARAQNDELATGDLALGAYNAWDQRFRETRHDDDKRERNRVRDIVTALGISGDIQFLVAKEAFYNAQAVKDPKEQQKAYEHAADELRAVAKSSSYYERSLVYLGRAYNSAGDAGRAIKTFNDLLERIQDEKFAVGLDKKKAQQRGFAHAEAVYHRAVVLLGQSQFQQVFDSLVGYEAQFEGQAPYFPNVVYHRILAKVGLGEIDAAEELLSAMSATHSGHPVIGHGTNSVASGHFKAYQAIEDKTSEDALGHLRSAAEYLDEYNRLTGYGSFQNLRNVGDWFREIGELERAEENYLRLIAKFGQKPNHTRAIESGVKPNLADVLLKLRKFQDALPLWNKVYARRSKDRVVVRSYALCLGGWMDEKEDRGVWEYTEVTGAGRYKQARDIWLVLKEGIEDAGDKNTPDWWECMTNFVYCQYMEGKDNPQLKTRAIRLIANWKAVLPQLGGNPFARRIKMLERALSR